MGRAEADNAGHLAQYGTREDEMRRHNDEDEEAQLLDNEDYEQLELDDASRPILRDAQRISGAAKSGSRRKGRRLPAWLQGPSPPRVHAIQPLLPCVQEYPIRWLDRMLPHGWQRAALLVVLSIAWLVALAVSLVRSKGALSDPAGELVRHVDCVDTLWLRNNECGVDGIDCQPFSNDSFSFRCPADCAGVRVLNPRHVGPLDVNYRPLVIGGPVYRGDSFLCGSAIHAGVIDDATGGCGAVQVVGMYYGFFSSAQHGIESIAFDSHFPLSFTVTKNDTLQCGGGGDPRRALFPMSVLATAAVSLFTTSSAVLFFTSFVGIFIHVGLVSDPPAVSGPSNTIIPQLLSTLVARLLPALFCAVVLYLMAVRRALDGLTAQVEKTFLWLGAFWVGALANHTLDWIPLSRLSAHDLAQQPGAKAALAVILLILVLAIAQQAYHLLLEGRLAPYLALYISIATVLAVLGAGAPPLLSLELRIHHYVLALLLLPGTAMQTRPSLIFQGLLLGLFVNGVARWGFDSVLQTAEALRGDAALGSALLPHVVPPLVYQPEVKGHWTISFKWAAINDKAKNEDAVVVEGISVLVNDVERYRAFWAAEGKAGVEDLSYTWTRQPAAGSAVAVATAEYFRFAFVGRGGRTLDYTEAGTWHANGSWSQGAGYYR